MTETVIKFNNEREILEFAKLANRCNDRVVLFTDNGIIDTKSFMKMCGIDITEPLKVEFHGDIPLEVREGMKKFIVN